MAAVVEGTATLLLHRYDAQAIARKAVAPKGSRERKTDDVDSYLYRTPDGLVGLPAVNVKRCLVEAGRYFDDPRSTGRRRQAVDLLRATLLVEPDLPLLLVGGQPVSAPDFIDRRRVVVQHQAVPRERPALLAGWRLAFRVLSLDARYVPAAMLRDVLVCAGRFVGLGDFRPDFGRFQVVSADEDRG